MIAFRLFGRPFDRGIWGRCLQAFAGTVSNSCRNRFACKAGRSWQVDETYVKIKGLSPTVKGTMIVKNYR